MAGFVKVQCAAFDAVAALGGDAFKHGDVVYVCNVFDAVARLQYVRVARAQNTSQVNRDFATKAVVDATNGKVTGVETVTYNGVDAFAVTVKRTDGSVITGYVDRSTGDIYEWVVVKEAPAPVKQYEEDDDDDDEYEDEEDERDNDDD